MCHVLLISIYLGGANGEHTRTCGTKAQEVNCNENAEAGVCACDSEDLCNSKSMTRYDEPDEPFPYGLNL